MNWAGGCADFAAIAHGENTKLIQMTEGDPADLKALILKKFLCSYTKNSDEKYITDTSFYELDG